MNKITIPLLYLLLSFLSACTCNESDRLLEDFQACPSSACGWIAEPKASLSIVETFHSSELGLKIPAQTAISRDFEVHAQELQFISSCDAGLYVHVTFSTPQGDTYTKTFVVQPTTFDRDYTWYRMATVLQGDADELDQIISITIDNKNSQSCVIDEIRTITTHC